MQNNTLEVVIKKTPISKNNYSNKDVKIVIDAGHGGQEIGAVGCLGHKEKNINLDVANRLKRILESHNFDVYMVRETDKYVSLEDRVKFAKEKGPEIQVALLDKSGSRAPEPPTLRAKEKFLTGGNNHVQQL